MSLTMATAKNVMGGNMLVVRLTHFVRNISRNFECKSSLIQCRQNLLSWLVLLVCELVLRLRNGLVRTYGRLAGIGDWHTAFGEFLFFVLCRSCFLLRTTASGSSITLATEVVRRLVAFVDSGIIHSRTFWRVNYPYNLSEISFANRVNNAGIHNIPTCRSPKCSQTLHQTHWDKLPIMNRSNLEISNTLLSLKESSKRSEWARTELCAFVLDS